MEQQAEQNKLIMEELFKTNFSLFDNLDDAIKKEQIKKINYIETIAHQLEKDLTNVNLLDIIENDTKILTGSESSINNALMEFDRSKYFDNPEEDQQEITELTEDQLKTITDKYSSSLTDRKSQIEREIKSHSENAGSYLRDYNQQVTSMIGKNKELLAIQEGDYTFVTEAIKEIIADDRFTLLGFTNNNKCIEFKINQDIICSHKNDRASVDWRVNLGKFKIKLDIVNGFNMELLGFENNLDSEGYIHPHVSSGTICLGNMQELVSECRAKTELLKMLDAALRVLTSYNDADPHRNLSYFVKICNQVQPNGELFKHVEPVTGGSSDDRSQEVTCSNIDCCHQYVAQFLPENEGDFLTSECPECNTETDHEFDSE